MVRQVNRYFVCDTVAELDNIRFDNLEGVKAFIRSTPSEEYIYSGGGWQLIAGSTVIESINTVETDLTTKQDTLVSATNIKTINGSSVLGSGDLVVSGAAAWGSITGLLADQTDLDLKLQDKLDNPTGTPDGTKYLRDDNTWQPVSGGSGLAQYQVRQMIRR